MKKKLITVLICVVACVALALTVFAAQAGSADDPLVSKSYVDDKISQVLQVLNNSSDSSTSNAQTNTTISQEEREKLKAEIIAELGVSNEEDLTGGSVPVENNSYVPVYAEVGQIILGGEGTEMILRSGKAEVYITGVAGIVNATTGKEMTNGSKASWNNIMIIPRNDGRGFKVTEAAWFLVKGDYEIK